MLKSLTNSLLSLFQILNVGRGKIDIMKIKDFKLRVKDLY